MDSVKKEHTLLSRARTGSRKGKLGCELVCTCAAPVGKLNLIHWSISTEESADVTEIVPELDFIVCLSCYHAWCCFVALLQIILFISGSPSSVRAAKTGSFRKAFWIFPERALCSSEEDRTNCMSEQRSDTAQLERIITVCFSQPVTMQQKWKGKAFSDKWKIPGLQDFFCFCPFSYI